MSHASKTFGSSMNSAISAVNADHCDRNQSFIRVFIIEFQSVVHLTKGYVKLPTG